MSTYAFDDNLNKIEVKDKATQEAKDQDQDGKISALESGKADTDHTHSEYATKTEIPDVSGFLPLTGGTLTGSLTIQGESSRGEFTGNLMVGTGILSSDDAGMMMGYVTQDESKGTMLFIGDKFVFAMGGSNDDASLGSLVDLGDEVFQWGRIYGTTIYQNGEQVASMSDIPNMSNYATKGEIPDVSGKANLTGNQEFKGEIRITRDNANVPLFVRAPNEENAWIGVTNKSGTGYFGVDADRNPMFMGWETEQIALMSDVPDENTLLKRSGGTMNGEIRFNGGSTQGGSKIVLENGTGQITNSTTGTLFGFLNANDVACGEATYNLLMRGKATRPTYNGNDMALKSDVPDVSNYATKSDLNSKAGTSVATTSANGLMSSTDKSKLNGVESGANKTVVDSALSSTSTNPLQNKVVNQAIYNQSVSLGNQISAKQDKLTAGEGITIENNVISATGGGSGGGGSSITKIIKSDISGEEFASDIVASKIGDLVMLTQFGSNHTIQGLGMINMITPRGGFNISFSGNFVNGTTIGFITDLSYDPEMEMFRVAYTDMTGEMGGVSVSRIDATYTIVRFG